MDELKALITESKPAGAYYYALVPMAPPTAAGARFPKDSNYQIEPEFELPGPSVPTGTYKVIYYPTDLPDIPYSKQAICRIGSPAARTRNPQAQPLNSPASAIISNDENADQWVPTQEELRLQRTQNSNDFLTHKFAVGVQRDAHVVARETYYTSGIKELLDHNREQSSHVREMSESLAKISQQSAQQMLELSDQASRLVKSVIETALVRVEQIKTPPPPPPPPPSPPPPPDWMGGLNNITTGVKEVLIAYLLRNKPGGAPQFSLPTTQAGFAGQPPASGEAFENALLSLLGQQTPSTPPAASKAGESERISGKGADAGEITPEAQRIRDLIKKNFKSKEELDMVVSVLVPDLPKK